MDKILRSTGNTGFYAQLSDDYIDDDKKPQAVAAKIPVPRIWQTKLEALGDIKDSLNT
jgi:hypothetical protein